MSIKTCLLGAIAAAGFIAAPASAVIFTYQADLTALNNSGVSGTATFEYDNSTQMLRVIVNASGLTPNEVHAQHIHGRFANDATCTDFAPASSPVAGACIDSDTPIDSTIPTIAANDIDGDGFLETQEGAPAYGPINLSLADASAGRAGLPGSFPMADAAGNLTFDQTYDLMSTSLLFDPLFMVEHEASDLFPLDSRVFVIHGVFVDNDNPAVPGDILEIQGPVEDYIGLLPAAAGELVLISSVPEPGALGLVGLGLLGLALHRRKRS